VLSEKIITLIRDWPVCCVKLQAMKKGQLRRPFIILNGQQWLSKNTYFLYLPTNVNLSGANFDGCQPQKPVHP
jgi:hypothetical protein